MPDSELDKRVYTPESPHRPKVRNCPLCGHPTIRSRGDKSQSFFWLNREDHTRHTCEPKVKISSKEEIEQLNAERGTRSTTQKPLSDSKSKAEAPPGT